MKRLFLLLLVVALVPLSAWGQAKVGTAGAQFLELMPGARAEGMGNAFVAIADDATCMWYNPAGLAVINRNEVTANHVQLPGKLNYDAVGVSYSLASSIEGALGVYASTLWGERMPITSPAHPAGTGETFGAQDWAIGLAYSRLLTDRFSVGISVRYVAELYDDLKAEGWTADIGTWYNTGYHSLRLGMIFGNFGPDMKFIKSAYPMPMSFRFGLAMDVFSTENHTLTIAAVGAHPNDNMEVFDFGAEYWFNQLVALRAGYKVNYDADGASFGIGVKPKFGSIKAKIDYSYTDWGALTQAHRVSLGIEF